jgi:hypothetical protein
MSIQRRFFIFLSALSMLFYSLASCAASDFVVIANMNSGVDKMSKNEVINVYMGRNRKLASGITALPLDLENPITEKANFYSVMVNKELSEISSYWARLVFSGQGSPPIQMMSQDEAIDMVINRKGAIAYVDRKKIDKRVKVVFDPLR